MTNAQRTVIWLGLFIVALNLVIKWSTVKTVIFGSGGSLLAASTPTPTATVPTPTPPKVQVV